MATTHSTAGKTPATTAQAKNAATAKASPAKMPAVKKAGKPAAAKGPVVEAAKPAKAAKAIKPAKAAGNGTARPQNGVEATAPKLKLVRDSFTIPKHEYAVLDELKQRAASLARPTKKSELLRAGIAALQRMPDKAFLAAVNAVPSLKTGRPGAAKPEEPAAAPVAAKKS